MTAEQKNMELMRTLDDAWNAQISTGGCKCVLRPPRSEAGGAARHES